MVTNFLSLTSFAHFENEKVITKTNQGIQITLLLYCRSIILDEPTKDSLVKASTLISTIWPLYHESIGVVLEQ